MNRIRVRISTPQGKGEAESGEAWSAVGLTRPSRINPPTNTVRSRTPKMAASG
jgi:hypothetical protein